MPERRKIAAIVATDVVGFSRMASVDEDRILARMRALRTDIIDPIVAGQNGRVFKRTGDGSFIEFHSVVEAVRCAISVQKAMAERNVGTPEDQRIVFRVGIHLGDVVEESDGDLMGDGVNIAARLEGVAKPGAICLSEDAYRQVRQRIDVEVSDLGAVPLKNIAEPIRVYSIEIGAPVDANRGHTRLTQKLAHKAFAPPRLSIAVLPFVNIGGDPEQEYFVDGVTESLTTDVSRIRKVYVVARNSAFYYKGKLLDVKIIGRELNVRYVVEGSIQRGGARMRVNVQLINAETGNHLWAERFDKPLADLLDMQDEIVARLASALNAHLVAAEAQRAEQAPSLDSMDLYFQGLAWLNKGTIPDSIARARDFFERALAADPGNVDALIGSARADVADGIYVLAANPIEVLAAAEEKLTRALSSVPDHALAHMNLGLINILTKRGVEGIAKCEHALALDRNLANAYSNIGFGKILIGHSEETEAHILEALRFSPRDTNAYIWMNVAGLAKLHLGSYEQAVAWFRRSVEANRNLPAPYMNLGAALALLGRLEEARSAVEAALALNPTFSVSRIRAAWTIRSDDPTFLAKSEGILEGMRRAGLTEE